MICLIGPAFGAGVVDTLIRCTKKREKARSKRIKGINETGKMVNVKGSDKSLK